MAYSRKDFTGRSLIDVVDLSGQTITGSCFSHETPDTHIFPEDMTGVTFLYCNLDNCFIPPGNTVGDGCSVRRYLHQPDTDETWIVDANNTPVEKM